MKRRFSVKTWLKIEIIIVCISLLIILALSIFPNINVENLNSIEKLQYDLGVYKETTPIWKKIGYSIAGILGIICFIIDYTMLRCKYCKKHIVFMNIYMNYCPYCSKKLD